MCGGGLPFENNVYLTPNKIKLLKGKQFYVHPLMPKFWEYKKLLENRTQDWDNKKEFSDIEKPSELFRRFSLIFPKTFSNPFSLKKS